MVTKVQKQDSIKCMHVHSSKTEQVSEIAMTPPLLLHYTDLVACIECMWTK